MGAADTITKEYMRENAIFADAFNYLLQGVGGYVDPNSLRELDTTEIAIPFGDDDSDEAVQKYRDILKSAVVKQDDKASYVLLGIENQTDIHYAMPVRNIIYDALQYGKQVSDIAAKHRKKVGGGHTKSEYLSGFYKTDKITPVITLVIHFGADEWDGPLSLHEMMDVPDYMLRLIPDYRIYLIDPAKMEWNELLKLQTSLREVMGYIKYSQNDEQLTSFLTASSRTWIERNAAQVIKAITKTPIEIPEGMEEINMCEAIEKMIAKSESKGKAEGEAQGIVKGKVSALADLVKEGLLNAKDAAARLNMTEAEFEDAVKKLA